MERNNVFVAATDVDTDTSDWVPLESRLRIAAEIARMDGTSDEPHQVIVLDVTPLASGETLTLPLAWEVI